MPRPSLPRPSLGTGGSNPARSVAARFGCSPLLAVVLPRRLKPTWAGRACAMAYAPHPSGHLDTATGIKRPNARGGALVRPPSRVAPAEPALQPPCLPLAGSSWSGWATSARTQTLLRAAWCSTAPARSRRASPSRRPARSSTRSERARSRTQRQLDVGHGPCCVSPGAPLVSSAAESGCSSHQPATEPVGARVHYSSSSTSSSSSRLGRSRRLFFFPHARPSLSCSAVILRVEIQAHYVR